MTDYYLNGVLIERNHRSIGFLFRWQQYKKLM